MDNELSKEVEQISTKLTKIGTQYPHCHHLDKLGELYDQLQLLVKELDTPDANLMYNLLKLQDDINTDIIEMMVVNGEVPAYRTVFNNKLTVA